MASMSFIFNGIKKRFAREKMLEAIDTFNDLNR